MAVKNKEEYEWFKSIGICTRCMHEKAEKGYVMCRMCRINYNDYMKCYSDTHPKTDEKKQKDKELAQKTYDRRHEQGLCFRCGKRPPIGTGKYSQCKICNSKNARHKRERDHKNGVIPTELRGNGLYCLRCCKPICNGEKLCQDCHTKAVENARKAAEASRVSPNRKHIYFGKYNKEVNHD